MYTIMFNIIKQTRKNIHVVIMRSDKMIEIKKICYPFNMLNSQLINHLQHSGMITFGIYTMKQLFLIVVLICSISFLCLPF